MQDKEFKEDIGRSITPVALPRMTSDELRDIIDKRVSNGVAVDPDVADDLVWAASGYPALIHRVMFAAAVRWLSDNLTDVVASFATGLVSAVLGFFRLSGIERKVVVDRVELDKAGITVAGTELENGLRQYIKTFESQDSSAAAGFAAANADEHKKAVLTDYARSDDDILSKAVVAALCLGEGLGVSPGLRPYLRATLLLDERRADASSLPSDGKPSTGVGSEAHSTLRDAGLRLVSLELDLVPAKCGSGIASVAPVRLRRASARHSGRSWSQIRLCGLSGLGGVLPRVTWGRVNRCC